MCSMRQSNVKVTRGKKHMTGMFSCISRAAEEATAAGGTASELQCSSTAGEAAQHSENGRATGVVVIALCQRESRYWVVNQG